MWNLDFFQGKKHNMFIESNSRLIQSMCLYVCMSSPPHQNHFKVSHGLIGHWPSFSGLSCPPCPTPPKKRYQKVPKSTEKCQQMTIQSWKRQLSSLTILDTYFFGYNYLNLWQNCVNHKFVRALVKCCIFLKFIQICVDE